MQALWWFNLLIIGVGPYQLRMDSYWVCRAVRWGRGRWARAPPPFWRKIGVFFHFTGLFGTKPHSARPFSKPTARSCMIWNDLEWHGWHVMLPQVWQWIWSGLIWVFLAMRGIGRRRSQTLQLSMYSQIAANSKIKKILLSGYFRIAKC